MHRFALFVDGSNLFGSLKGMGLQVDDYEAFYRFVFDKAVEQWKETFNSSVSPPAQLFWVYWYVVGEMDEWDLATPKAQLHLKERYEGDRDLNRKYMALAGQESEPGATQEEIGKDAWAMCFGEFKEWYERKQGIRDGMQRFHHGVKRSTDYIDIVECGHWKVDFVQFSLAEKGLDTTLAVDMITKLDNYDVALVLSGDADSIPSINYVKGQNKHVAAVEFVSGYPPAERGRGFSSHLKLGADFVVRVYEMDLVSKGLAKKGTAETA